MDRVLKNYLETLRSGAVMDHRERDPLLQSDRFYPSMYLYRFLNRFRGKHLTNCPSQTGAVERGDELLGSGHASDGRAIVSTGRRIASCDLQHFHVPRSHCTRASCSPRRVKVNLHRNSLPKVRISVCIAPLSFGVSRAQLSDAARAMLFGHR